MDTNKPRAMRLVTRHSHLSAAAFTFSLHLYLKKKYKCGQRVNWFAQPSFQFVLCPVLSLEAATFLQLTQFKPVRT